jgi:hypothetical protein
MHQTRSPLAAFVLAGVAAATAAVTWTIGFAEAQEVAAACNQHYNLFAELALCRAPAFYGAVGWLLFTGAIAAAWVGGVRRSRNSAAASGGLHGQAGHQPAAVAREQLQRSRMSAGYPFDDRQPQA